MKFTKGSILTLLPLVFGQKSPDFQVTLTPDSGSGALSEIFAAQDGIVTLVLKSAFVYEMEALVGRGDAILLEQLAGKAAQSATHVWITRDGL